jgi:hypothetical protein
MKMFDSQAPITIQLRGPEGTKTLKVRFPTDEEWIERQRRRKIIIKQLGRGVSETTISGGEEADAALLAKIRQGEEPELDAYEAARVIEQLSMADVEDVAPCAEGYYVTLRVIGGTVGHILKPPSAKDLFDYRRGFARVLDVPYNRQELTINLAAASALYQKLLVATVGYAGAAPVIHQAVAVKAAIDALEAGFEDRNPNS